MGWGGVFNPSVGRSSLSFLFYFYDVLKGCVAFLRKTILADFRLLTCRRT